MQAQPSRIALLWVLTGVLFAQRVPNRYIVELTTPPVAEQARASKQSLRTLASETHRARIRGEQANLRTRVEALNVKVLDSAENVANVLFVETSDPSALQQLPNVKRVVPVRAVHMVLDRAVLIHKVAEAWDQIGADRAGAGVKVAIIDSGIDISHAGMQDSTLTVPDGFPKTNYANDSANTNSKVIVARSYVALLPSRDTDYSARDRVGHGTALAMAAAGVRNAGPMATITGVAPKAYLGNYKVFGTPGFNDNSSDDAIIKAVDDAVADGMDVISLSLGSEFAPRLADDLEVQAVERAAKAGVIVVAAAGNEGPDFNTMSSPGTAPSVITVGASTNDRTFASSVDAGSAGTFIAYDGNGPTPPSIVTAQTADAGLGCSTLSSNTFSGKVALILRGTCTFETKLLNAQRAGAVAGLVYTTDASPDPIYMDVGTATLPAQMVSYSDGTAILAALPVVSMDFTTHSVPVKANRLSDFTSAGPSVNSGIKPDLVAVGTDFYTATQRLDPNGDMYDSTGYILVDGTSFSTPLVAGAAALLKGARPGLTADQYRSLLINSASPVEANSGGTPSVQQSGAGSLNMIAALHAVAAASPVSLSFGSGTGDNQSSATLTVTNVGAADDTFSLSVVSRTGDVVPSISTNELKLAAGASIDIPVNWQVSGLSSGEYEGYISIQSASTGTEQRVPYWYAVTGSAAHILVLDAITSGRRGSLQRDAVYLRVTDGSGVALPNADVKVTAVSGGGSFRQANSYDSDIPGLIGLDLQLGITAGNNVFHVEAGSASIQIAITGR